MTLKYTTEEIIRKFKDLHGDKYDYSKVVYSGTMVKVTIICKEHGDFYQAPNTHLSGKGCMTCAANKRGKTKRSNTKDFVEKASKIHNNKFDYSRVKYTTNFKKIEVICPIHGLFTALPSNHLAGRDCNKCAIEVRNASKRSNTEEFLVKCKAVCQDRYDLSKVVYGKNNMQDVEIICRIHGSFFTRPANFLDGKGCPSCAKTGFTPHNPAWVYILASESGMVKVGITNNVKNRLRVINKDSGATFKVYSKYYFGHGDDAYDVEQQVLQELRSKYETVPYDFSGSTECFYDVSKEEVERLVVSKLTNV